MSDSEIKVSSLVDERTNTIPHRYLLCAATLLHNVYIIRRVVAQSQPWSLQPATTCCTQARQQTTNTV